LLAVKDGRKKRVLQFVKQLRETGVEWPEFKAIEKSVLAND
jgi:hypothetical protein